MDLLDSGAATRVSVLSTGDGFAQSVVRRMRAFPIGAADKMKPALRIATALTLYASATFATTLFDNVGNPINGGQTSGIVAEGWSLTSTFTNVSITAGLLSGSGYTAYLMNQIGPGTTVANQVAIASNFSIPTGSTPPIFTGLTLGPGNYYLVVELPASGATGWTILCAFAGTCSNTLGSGVSFLGTTTPASSPAAYAPASSFTFRGDAREHELTVTGTAAASAPEPSTVFLSLPGFGVLAWTQVRRRSRRSA